MLAAEENARQVRFLDPPEGRERGLEHGGVLGRGDAGVVEQHVDATPRLTGLVQGVGDLLLVGQVGPQRDLGGRLGRDVDPDHRPRPRGSALRWLRRFRQPRR